MSDPRFPGIDLSRTQLGHGRRYASIPDGIAVVVTESGSGRVRYGGQDSGTSLETGYLFGPDCVWTAHPVTRSGWCFWTLRIDEGPASRISEQIGVGGLQMTAMAAHAIGRDATVAVRRGVEAFTKATRFRARLAAIIDLIQTVASERVTFHEGVRSSIIEHAQQDLLDHVTTPVPLSALARHASLSRCHFLRLFRDAVGVPPYTYGGLLRVRHAARLLRDGVPISEVAHLAGFCDQSHLTRWFRRQMGVTPGQYRNALVTVDRPPITIDTALSYRFRDGAPLIGRWTALRAAISSKTRPSNAQ